MRAVGGGHGGDGDDDDDDDDEYSLNNAMGVLSSGIHDMVLRTLDERVSGGDGGRGSSKVDEQGRLMRLGGIHRSGKQQ